MVPFTSSACPSALASVHSTVICILAEPHRKIAGTYSEVFLSGLRKISHLLMNRGAVLAASLARRAVDWRWRMLGGTIMKRWVVAIVLCAMLGVSAYSFVDAQPTPGTPGTMPSCASPESVIDTSVGQPGVSSPVAGMQASAVAYAEGELGYNPFASPEPCASPSS
jgi:hypothetical protein